MMTIAGACLAQRQVESGRRGWSVGLDLEVVQELPRGTLSKARCKYYVASVVRSFLGSGATQPAARWIKWGMGRKCSDESSSLKYA